MSRQIVKVSGTGTGVIFRGAVSGDVTTITSVKLEQSSGEWVYAIKENNMPTIMIIDGKQYRWTINSTFTVPGIEGIYVKEATLNIGTKLTINKPFFKIVQGQDPTQGGSVSTFSFYDLGQFNPLSFDPGATDFVVDGKTTVPINIQNTDEASLFSIRLSADAIYRFKWQIGNKRYTMDRKTGGDSKIYTSYKIPKEWNTEITISTQKDCMVSVQVIFGTHVFAERATFVQATVPEDCVPEIKKIQITDTKGRVPTSWEMFVQNNSNIAITSIDYAKSYGAQIKSIQLEAEGKKYSGTLDKLPQTDTLEEYGITEVTVKIIDTRGREAKKTARVTVVEYNPPTLKVNSIRCNEAGTIHNEGMFFLASTDSTYSTCNGKNKATLRAVYKLSNQYDYTSQQKDITIGQAETVCGGDLDTEFSYDVKYVLSDAFNTVTVIDFVSTAIYAMHFLHGGRGVAFGSKATVENAADFSFDAIFKGNVKFVKEDGSEVTIQQILNKLGL